ncbi:mannose-6-phosphate isomerase, class I [Arthrobacter sp. N1]|uniref:mannose-6-phosphate isomerase, class I n=1 Tax=Arthrobacter sp. N1 TaxID=619291 RepID=UPI003BB0A061
MHLLDNTLRPYAWGSERAIADLLGREPSGGPEAELWIGAHPDSPSAVVGADGSRRGLDHLIGEDPRALLGDDVADRYDGRLPFLLKVLAAGSALSLQVHPSLEQAGAGFDAEEAAGIPADAPHRNYRDRNHKPEMIYALSPFEALCGFRPLPESVGIFTVLAAAVAPGSRSHDLLDAVSALLATGGETSLRSVFTTLLEAPAEIVRDVAAASARRAAGTGSPAEPAGAVDRDLATIAELSEQYPGDPGVLVALLLNRVSLHPGEALYLPAGNIHAYLSGLGIEVMASSDNVLRGGLTPKHVDTGELLATVVFEPLAPPSLVAEFTLLDQELYRPPFDEFQLQRILLTDPSAGPGGRSADGADDGSATSALPAGESLTPAHVPVVQNGPVVVLAVSGAVLLDTPNATLLVPRGASAFVAAGEAPLIVRPAADAHGSTDGPVLAFAVTVGDSRAL